MLLVACAPPREVEVLSPRRGELVESFSEEARTRLGRTYPVRMPLTGRIGRIGVE
ncbi:RND transporter, partial [bacterium CPR1]|nr:RND transporter [bacterium CPR1]